MPRQSSRIANCAADGTPYPSDFLKNRKKTWWHFPKLFFSFMHERISINDAKSISGTGKGSPNWTGNINGTVIKLANGDLYDGEWNITEPLQADWKKGKARFEGKGIFYNTAGKSAGKYYIGNFSNNECVGIGYTAYRQDQRGNLFKMPTKGLYKEDSTDTEKNIGWDEFEIAISNLASSSGSNSGSNSNNSSNLSTSSSSNENPTTTTTTITTTTTTSNASASLSQVNGSSSSKKSLKRKKHDGASTKKKKICKKPETREEEKHDNGFDNSSNNNNSVIDKVEKALEDLEYDIKSINVACSDDQDMKIDMLKSAYNAYDKYDKSICENHIWTVMEYNILFRMEMTTYKKFATNKWIEGAALAERKANASKKWQKRATAYRSKSKTGAKHEI